MDFALVLLVKLWLLILFASFCSFLYFPIYCYCSFNYCHSNSCHSFSLLEAIPISFPLIFTIAFKIEKSNNNHYCDSWKSDIPRANQKRSHEPIYKLNTKWSKDVKSDKVERVITKWEAIEKKSNIAIAIWENLSFW